MADIAKLSYEMYEDTLDEPIQFISADPRSYQNKSNVPYVQISGIPHLKELLNTEYSHCNINSGTNNVWAWIEAFGVVFLGIIHPNDEGYEEAKEYVQMH